MERNLEISGELLQIAGHAGSTDAIVTLADCHLQNSCDEGEAYRLYKEATSQGNLYGLGKAVCLKEGRGVVHKIEHGV